MPLWHKIKLLYSFLFQAFFLPSPEELTKMVYFIYSIYSLILTSRIILLWFSILVAEAIGIASQTNFTVAIFYLQLKDMDDVDMLTLIIQEMSKEFPTLMDTLVHERDQLVHLPFCCYLFYFFKILFLMIICSLLAKCLCKATSSQFLLTVLSNKLSKNP